MDSDRIFKIIIMDLTLENIKLEEKLENIVNSTICINEKTIIIKEILSKIVNNENSIVKFTSMFSINK